MKLEITTNGTRILHTKDQEVCKLCQLPITLPAFYCADLQKAFHTKCYNEKLPLRHGRSIAKQHEDINITLINVNKDLNNHET